MIAKRFGNNIAYHGDCIEVMGTLGALGTQVDSIVTDPPYHLSTVKRFANSTPAKYGTDGLYQRASKGFMGKEWDGGDIAFQPDTWRRCYDLLKPGGYLLAFSGSRTYHRIACAIEDAGFEIRDQLMWLYSTGFPKSHDVSKAIDKAAGAEREVVGSYAVTREFKGRQYVGDPSHATTVDITAPATDAAREWQGWGTALKPSFEPLVCAQKPLSDGDLTAKIGSKLDVLESELWSMLPVNIAVEHFGLSQSEYDAACASAQWTADERRNTWDDLCARMDTSQCVSVVNTSLNTVQSWRNTLVALLSDPSMSTIGTESSMTIDWKTLRSCLSAITPRTIIQAATSPDGWTANAGPAERYFNAELSRLNAIRELSVHALATGNPHIDYPVGAAKPQHRPVVMARKPLIGTVAENVLTHGTGAINIDACRIQAADAPDGRTRHGGGIPGNGTSYELPDSHGSMPAGRFPANVIHDSSDEVLAAFPNNTTRFFYSAKATKKDRAGSKHPTVKPVALIEYFCKLVTQPGGVVLDPFAGSGTLGAAWPNSILIEREEEYYSDIIRRLSGE